MNAEPFIHLMQIVYNDETMVSADRHFPILDNTANLRPDWFEYWPIRNYFKDNEIDDYTFYGFFSPKFTEKTSYSLEEISDYIKQHHKFHDVFIFSPMPDQGCFFINVFEQQEIYDNGFQETMNHFVKFCFFGMTIDQMVMSSKETIYSNYFVARGIFWKEWLRITNLLFELSESHQFPDYNKKTDYEGVERKVFMQERVASLILAHEPKFRSLSYKTFLKPWSASKLQNFIHEAVVCDSLKMSYNSTKDPAYINQFYEIRDKVIKKLTS